MRIGIIGAGVAGLATAKTLLQAGFEVLVVEKAPDVGGVWSRTRRYPGLITQSTKASYGFSDFPMPRSYPEWPAGEQVQAWLAAYAQSFDLLPHLRLSTEVTQASTAGDSGWKLMLRSMVDGETSVEYVDRLIVANGVFSDPEVPHYPGAEEFSAASGRVCTSTDVHGVEDARNKHVLIVGYGKSACDIAVPLSDAAAGTNVIARRLLWKIPRKVGRRVNFKFLLLTRLGEALFHYRQVQGFERFLHGPADGVRRRMLNSLGAVSVRQFKLAQLGLIPPGNMEDIIKGAIGLSTEGFFEAVKTGRIVVNRDTTIAHLLTQDGRPFAQLADGTILPADLIVVAAGFKQGVPFFQQELQDRLVDERSNFMLYRQILPVDVEGLYFNGYNSSFFCPLGAEIAAAWIAAHLAGELVLPGCEKMTREITHQLAFMDHATGRHHNRGTKIIPFSMHNIDEMLRDLDLNISPWVRAWHWLNPVNPRAYGQVTLRLVRRLGSRAGTSKLLQS